MTIPRNLSTLASGVDANGVLGVEKGGTGTSSTFALGSIVFAGASGVYAQNNANLFWDNTNSFLGIGTASPNSRLNVVGSTTGDLVRITQTGNGNALIVEDSLTDTTSFVIDSSGRVIVGDTVSQPSLGVTNTPSIGVFGVSTSNNGFANYSYTASTGASFFNFSKSRSTIPGTPGIVTNSDDIGYIKFNADDGTQFVEAARIWSEVDGVPGVSSMPGRLIFSTTPSGAAAPLERMRIGSTGNIGIGTAGTEPFTIRNLRQFSGATSAYGISQGGQIQSDVTSNVYVNHTAPTTQAAAFNMTAVYHYAAVSLTLGAGSSVTNQYGFFVGNGLTSATNNYGFYSDIASGTGRWNFYSPGTASSYLEGSLGIGSASLTTQKLRVRSTPTDITATTSIALFDGGHTLTANNALVYRAIDAQAQINQGAFNATVSLASGGGINGIRSYTTTDGASGTVTAASGFLADVRNIAAGVLTNGVGFVAGPVLNTGGGTLTNAMGFYAAAQTSAINNYGFYSDVASGTGRWNFYANGNADNYFGGATVVNVNSASDALRITQAGAGNALVVEDTANPDSSPFVIDSGGRLNIGSTTWYANAGLTASQQFNGLGTSSSLTLNSWQSGINVQARLTFGRGDSSIVGDFSDAVDSGDNLGSINFTGSDGTAFIEAASINAAVDGAPGTNDMPGRLVFSTTADGTSTPTERMRINSAGDVLVGTTTVTSKLTVNGDIAGAFFVNPTTISANYTIPTNCNAMNAGPISVNSGVTVTVPSGSTWTVT